MDEIPLPSGLDRLVSVAPDGRRLCAFLQERDLTTESG